MVAVATIAMTSCGGNELCECFEMGQEIRKEMKAAGGDADKEKAIEDKYKDQKETCEAAKKAMRESMKDATTEEKKAKQEEMIESCPAMKKAKEEGLG